MFLAVVVKINSKWCVFYTGSGVSVPPTAKRCTLAVLKQIIANLPRHQGHVLAHGFYTSSRQVPPILKEVKPLTAMYFEVLQYFKRLYLPWSREFIRYYARTTSQSYMQLFYERKKRENSCSLRLNCDKWESTDRVARFFKKQGKPFRGPVPTGIKFAYNPEGALKFGLEKAHKTIKFVGDETLRIQESLAVKSLLPPGFHKKKGTCTYNLQRTIGIKKLTWPDHEINLQELLYLQRAIEQTNTHFQKYTIDYTTPPFEHGFSDPDCQVYGWDIPVASWRLEPSYLGPARIMRKDVPEYEYRFNVYSSPPRWTTLYLLSTKLPTRFYKHEVRVSMLHRRNYQDFLNAPSKTVALLRLEENHTRWCYKTDQKKIVIFNSHNRVGPGKGGKQNFKSLQTFCKDKGVDIEFYKKNKLIYDQLSEGSCTIVAFSRALQMCREHEVEKAIDSVHKLLVGPVVMFAKALWVFGKKWTENYAWLVKHIRVPPVLKGPRSSFFHLPSLTFPKSLFGSSRRIYLRVRYVEELRVSLVIADHKEAQTNKIIQKVSLSQQIYAKYITDETTINVRDLDKLHVWLQRVDVNKIFENITYFFATLSR